MWPMRRRRRPRAEGEQRSVRAPRTRRGVSLSSRLAATVLGVGFVSLAGATVVGVNAGQTLGRSIVEDSLASLNTAGAVEVSAQLRYYERLSEQLAASPQAGVAIREFSAALEELAAVPEAELRQQREQLIEAYEDRYFAPLRAAEESVQLDDFVPSDPAAVYLQATYSVSEGPITDPMAVSDADDGSQWSAVHARVHPVYRNAVDRGGLLDVYLVDAASERVVYSAAKGPELGTSLALGSFGGTIIARAADAAAASDTGIVTDLSYYRAASDTPIGAAAAPVRDENGLVGVVVLTYDAGIYTQRLTSLMEATGTADFGVARDLYVIGAGGTTRSDPQGYLDDPEGFLEASVAAGVLSEESRDDIERTGSTVLLLPASDATARAAQNGDAEFVAATNMVGSQTVGQVRQLPEELGWSTVIEVGADAADSTITSFRRLLLFGAAVFVIALAFLAVAWANSLMRPVRVMSDFLGRSPLAGASESGPGPLRIPDSSPLEFHRLADSLTAMSGSLRLQQGELRAARAERLDVLERMLPASIAQRISRGDVESLDEVPSATVVVAVVLGLGALVEEHRGGDRRLIDQLHGELDDIAFEHGLDRIKVVGDAYFAACGHDRPYIDHAPRCVAFAEHVGEAVRRLCEGMSVRLDTATGVNTGPVTVGMSGGGRLVYDVWGPTVTTAHALARMAGAGEIVITDATRARLPEGVEVVAWNAELLERDGSPAAASGGQLWTVANGSTAAPDPAGTEAVR